MSRLARGWVVVLLVSCSSKDEVARDRVTSPDTLAWGGDTPVTETGSLDTGQAPSLPGTTGTGTTRPRPQRTVDPDDRTARIRGRSSVRVGLAVAGIGDHDGDGLADVVIGTSDADREGRDAGAVYLFPGPVSGDLGLADALSIISGAAGGDAAGRAVAAVGDADGDGYDDLVVQAHRHGDDAGLASVFFGPIAGDHLVTSGSFLFEGDRPGMGVGEGLAGLGDADGDGTADLAVGAAMAAPGRVYVWHAGLAAGQWSPADADAQLRGEPGVGARAGSPLAGGDLDGDGLGDLVVSDVGYGDGSGAVYAVVGPFGGTIELVDATGSVKEKTRTPALLGTLLATADTSGDGVAEPVLSTAAPPSILVFHDGLFGTRSPSDAPARVELDIVRAVQSVGDTDLDGHDDLLVSGVEWVYLFRGPFQATYTSRDAVWVVQDRPGDGWQMGSALGLAGDTDGDGGTELAVGVLEADVGGAVYLFDAL